MERMTIQQLLKVRIHQESQVFAVLLVLVKKWTEPLKNGNKCIIFLVLTLLVSPWKIMSFLE